MKIIALSDIHGALQAIEKAAGLLTRADLVIVAGDITRSKSRAEAEEIISALERFNRNILAVHGNWDRIEVNDLLVERNYSLHATGKVIGGIGFFGVGGSSPTPMNTATEYSEAEITRFLTEGYEMVREAARVVLVSHCPPRGVRDLTCLGLPGGSQSVRTFIETHRVDLCLCGHIHEAGGVQSFKKTIVANGGTFKRETCLIVEIAEDIHVREEKIAP